MALATLASIPLAIFHFIFQRYFVRGIVASGLKG